MEWEGEGGGEGGAGAPGSPPRPPWEGGSAHDPQVPHRVETHPPQQEMEGVREGGGEGEGAGEGAGPASTVGCAHREGEAQHLESHPPHPERHPDRQPVENVDESEVPWNFERRQLERVHSGSSGYSSILKPCEKCREATQLLSEKSRSLWQLLDSEHCCEKIWIKFLADMKSRFQSKADQSCLSNSGVLNLIKHILEVPYAEELAKVRVERFLDAERFFGFFGLCGDRCFFLKNVEELWKESCTTVSKKKKISWFAGRLSRNDAESKLASQKKGTFLVRMSETQANQGSFVVSVQTKEPGDTEDTDSQVEHFEIEGHPAEAQRGDPPSLCLEFRGQRWPSLPLLVQQLRGEGLEMEAEGGEGASTRIRLATICPGLPLEQVFSGYRR